MSKRNVLLALLLAALGLCCCALAALALAGAAGYGLLSAAAPARPTRDPNATPAPTPGPETLAQMDAIAQAVIARRGLQPSRLVDQKFLSPDELRQRTRQDFEKDMSPQEWEDYQHSLVAFGMAPAELDLHELLLRLYSEGVAGFYDPKTGELVVISAAGGLNAYERTTYAHEYNHALQDQNYGFEALGDSEIGWSQDSERASAVRALAEGDSSLLEEQYQQGFSAAEKREYDQVLAGLDASIYAELPAFMLRDFFFPYGPGLDFVRSFYDQGGWTRVDELWRDPPVSTEQILHPEHYASGDQPLLVERPALTDTLGAGWREIDRGVLGEWWTYLLLGYQADPAARLSDKRAAEAAAGWGGDSYSVFYQAETQAAVIAAHFRWDSPAEADDFVQAFQTYGQRRFGGRVQTQAGSWCWGGAQVNCLFSNGVDSLWLSAPDRATLERLRALYPEFP